MDTFLNQLDSNQFLFVSSPIQNSVHYKMARVSFLPGISHICYSVIFDDKLGDKDARGVTGSKPVTKPLPLESWGSYQFYQVFKMVIPGCRFIMDKKRSVKLTLEKVSNRQHMLNIRML